MKGFSNLKAPVSIVIIVFFSVFVVGTGFARAEGAARAQVEKSSPIGTEWPAGAWILESIGAVIAAAGFTLLGLGYSEIAQRDEYYNNSKSGYKVKATTIREYEERGITFATAGWITAGIGATAMAVGALWFLFHRSTPQPKLHLPPSLERGETLVERK